MRLEMFLTQKYGRAIARTFTFSKVFRLALVGLTSFRYQNVLFNKSSFCHVFSFYICASGCGTNGNPCTPLLILITVMFTFLVASPTWKE
jgi:hypothetical protein